MPITGPRVEMPMSLSQIFDYDEQGKIISVKPEWASFWSSVQQICFLTSRSGPTGSRPTSTSGRFVGEPYMDTTLGLPVFLKSASSNVWVKADGTPA